MKIQSIVLIFTLSISTWSCDPADIQKALDTFGESGVLSNSEVASGLKEALVQGIGEGAARLARENGYLDSPYKILLPAEAQTVVQKLKVIPGFNKVEQEIITRINRSAEDAAKKAKPIFVNAIRQMTFKDAMSILMGEKNAATQYLHKSTYNPLYGEFQPVILNSLNKFGAIDYWEKAVKKYNSIPFVKKLNPRLDDHVATQALTGLFNVVEKEERAIRVDPVKRTTALLKKVFAKQD